MKSTGPYRVSITRMKEDEPGRGREEIFEAFVPDLDVQKVVAVIYDLEVKNENH